MSFELQDHNFRTRMNFAYMADALLVFNGNIRPGTTVERMLDSKHEYAHMWRMIEKLYEDMTDKSGTLLSELSKSEFMHYCSAATSSGFYRDSKHVSAELVRSKGAEWSRRGWFRYEENRDEKVKTAKRFGMIGGLILTSFIL